MSNFPLVLTIGRESVVTVTDVLTAYLMQRLLINNLRYNIVTDTESGLVSSLVMFYTLTDLFGEMSQTYKLIKIIADTNSSIRCKWKNLVHCH